MGPRGAESPAQQTPRPNPYTGKTYDSIGSISQFLSQHSKAAPAAPAAGLPRPNAPARPLPSAPPAARKPARTGMTVTHPKYGTGTVVRREGEGDDAKITVHFPKAGLKKLIERYAGLKRD